MTAVESISSHEELRDAAAEREAHYFQGTRLHPFSYDHDAAFQRYLRYMGTYMGSLETNVAFLNICLMTADECDALRSKQDFNAFQKRCRLWAQANKVTSRNAIGEQVGKVVDEVWEELQASEFDVIPPKVSEPLDPKA